MKFCPKCGTLMLPKKNEADEAQYTCQCGYSEIAGDTKITSQSKAKKVEEVVVSKQDDDSRLPTCKEKCDKCGNEEAYYWDLQTRASDEPPTRFFKCTKCKTTWREY